MKLETKIIRAIKEETAKLTSIEHAKIYFENITDILNEKDPSTILELSKLAAFTLCITSYQTASEFDLYLEQIKELDEQNILKRDLIPFIKILETIINSSEKEVLFIQKYLIKLGNGIKDFEPIQKFAKKNKIEYTELVKKIWTLIEITTKSFNSNYDLLLTFLQLYQTCDKRAFQDLINIYHFRSEYPFGIRIEGKAIKISNDNKHFCKEKRENLIKECNIEEIINHLLSKNIEFKKEWKKVHVKSNEKIEALKQLQKNMQKKQESYLSLSKVGFSEYKFYPELIEKIANENEQFYQTLKEENDSKNSVTLTEIENLFFEYQIPVSHLKEETLDFSNTTLKNVKELLTYITSSSLIFLKEDIEALLIVLKYSNLEIVKFIENVYLNKQIDKTFINKNIGIFLTEEHEEIEGLYPILKENLTTLTSSKCQIPEHIIFIDPEYLKNMVTLSKEYHLNLNDTNIIKSLENKYLFDFIDVLIELGLKEQVKIEPYVLTMDLEKIVKRFVIAKNMQIPFLNDKGCLRRMLLTGNNFYIKDENLDQYIENHIPYMVSEESFNQFIIQDRYKLQNKKEVKLLDQFYLKDDEYEINGITISRNKVLRNLECIENIEDAILLGSILGLDDIIKIKSELEESYVKIKGV